jgi:ribonuclease P protein component
MGAAGESESPPTPTQPAAPATAGGPRLGLVVPKRCARRSVTRNLIRRLARAAFARHCKDLPVGDWVLRLRETIDPRQFISASSMPLRRALSTEMTLLFTAAAQAAGAGRPVAARRAAKAAGARGRS